MGANPTGVKISDMELRVPGENPRSNWMGCWARMVEERTVVVLVDVLPAVPGRDAGLARTREPERCSDIDFDARPSLSLLSMSLDGTGGISC